MLVERGAELDGLEAALSEAETGPGQIIIISGEAGIGKSSLIAGFKEKMLSQYPDLNWFSGGCEALFTPRTLGPIHDMAADLGDEVVTALNADISQSGLYNAMLSSLQSAGTSVMVCEDLHWADRATLDLIKFISRRLSVLNLLLVLTFRGDEVGLTHPLTQVLGDLPGGRTHRFALQPLSRSAVNDLARLHGREGAELYDITDGNPFYLTELLASRSDPGFLPASVKDAVALRLSQLEPSEREFLERISVMPSVPGYEFLEALLGADALDLFSSCVSKGLLVEDGLTVRFRHELARLATVDRITPAKRRLYHAECLRVLIEPHRRSPLDQIVHHAAGAHDSQIVLQYAPKAAEAAAQAGSHHEAAAHYASALRFVDDAEPELAARLYEDWSYESTLSDRIGEDVIDARRHALTLWRALKRPEKVGENLRHISRLHWYRGESTEATRFADQAILVLEALPASPERAMAYSLRSQLHMLKDQMVEAVQWGEKALDVERDYPNLEIRMHALNNIGTAKVFRNKRDGLVQLNESLSLALAHDHHEHAARAYNNLAEFAVDFRDFDLAERILSDGLAYDTEHDLDAWTHYLSGRLALLRLDQGRIDDAITIARGVVSLERPSFLSKLPAELVLSRALMRRGDPEAEASMQLALSDAIATDELQHIVPARLTLIEWAWLTGSPARARDHMLKLLDVESDERHPWNIGARDVWGDRLGLRSELRPFDHLPEPYRLELAGDYSAAASEWDRLGLPYEAALVRLREPANRETLSEVHDVLSAMNAELAASMAQRLAEAEGVRLSVQKQKRGPYGAAKTHPMGLTAKEQQVLKYLGEGMSNKDISDELHRSQRTVEHHVSSILAKLSAPNRMAAILRVQREPWLVQSDQDQPKLRQG